LNHITDQYFVNTQSPLTPSRIICHFQFASTVQTSQRVDLKLKVQTASSKLFYLRFTWPPNYTNYTAEESTGTGQAMVNKLAVVDAA
jgi:nitrate reductase assembly molybdenum cofactor insertion protein NarJ